MNKFEKLIGWCDKAMAFSFYALIYFLPISIALTEIFSTLALLCWFLKRGTSFYMEFRRDPVGMRYYPFLNTVLLFLKSFKPAGSCLTIPITTFLFFNFISMILSKHHVVSLEGFLGKTLQNAFIYFNFIECINSRKRLKIFLRAFFLSATLVSISGIYQYFIGQEFILGNMFEGRISSSLRQANDFAAYLLVVIPILLSVASLNLGGMRQKAGNNETSLEPFSFLSKQEAIFGSILFVLTIICLGLTYSRGAWIGFLIAILFFSFSRQKAVVVNIMILILFFGIFYPQLREYRNVSLINDVVPEEDTHKYEPQKIKEVSIEQPGKAASFVSSGQGEFVLGKIKFLKDTGDFFRGQWGKTVNIVRSVGGSGRGGYWREAFHMIRDYPLFGVGVNAYSVVAPGYKISWGGYPHNCYLQMIVEIGIPGFLSFLWILFRVFRGIRERVRIQDESMRMLFVGALAGFSGFLVHSFFDTNFYSVQLGSLMWVIMGMIAAIQQVGTKDKKDNGQRKEGSKMKTAYMSRTTMRICLLLLIVFSIFFCYLRRTTLNPRYGEVFYAIGRDCRGCSVQKRLNYFFKALSYDPNLSKAYYELGDIYGDRGEAEKAFQLYLKATTLDHRYADAYWKVGYAYYRKGDFDAAFRYLLPAYLYDSNRADANYYLGLLYEMKKQYDDAVGHYLKIKCPNPHCAEVLARVGALLHLLNKDPHAMSVVEDLQRMQRNDLAGQLENFIKTNEYPEYMNEKD